MGRAVVEDEVEARAVLSRVKTTLFQRPTERARLGRYLLDRKLGSGAFGIVYLAYDPDLDRNVALKALRPSIGLSDSARLRFFREARLLGSVLEPGLAAVFDVGSAPPPPELETPEGGDVLYIVMEFVDGPNLASWLRSEERTWKAVRDVFVRAGHGLAAAHDKGIVHRDFKPGNVLMGSDGAVKVADFGLAHEADTRTAAASGPNTASSEVAAPSLTQTGVVMGTPAYMAPEQHLGDPADPLADQFAFCAALYHGLCRQYAFGRGSAQELTERKLGAELQPWPRSSKVPRWIRAVIERGLRPNPPERFPSMHALLARLERSPLQRFVDKARWLVAPVAVAGLAYGAVQALEPADVDIRASSDAGADLEGMEIEVDGEPVPLHDGSISVPPGHHIIEVSARGHSPTVRAIEAEAGGRYDFGFQLQHARGSIDISAAPAAAHIFVDGVDHGSRVHGLSLTTGPHSIEVRLANHYTQQLDLRVDDGQRQNLHVALEGVETWAHSAPGFTTHVQWIPDITGDFREELALIRGTGFEILDPWTDTVLMEQAVAHGHRATITLADVDGDGIPECFAYAPGDGANLLTSWTLAPGTAEPNWEIKHSGERTVAGQLAILDGDAPTLVVQRGASLEARRPRTGTLLWRKEAPDISRVQSLGPLVLAEHPTGLQALDPRGTVVWQIDDAFTPKLVGDDDGDGILDFWATNASGSATLYRGSDGEPLSAFAQHGTVRVQLLQHGRFDPAYAWTNEHGTEIVDRAGTVQRRVAGKETRTLVLSNRAYVASFEGNSLGLTDIHNGTNAGVFPQATWGPLRAGDFNGDGRRELMAGGTNGDVRFLDEDLAPLATLSLSRSIKRIWTVHDGNHDGTQDLVFENNAGVFMVAGPTRKWAVRSDHGFRATPSVIRRDDHVEIVTTLEANGARDLARIRASDGRVRRSPALFASDLHRAADVLADDTSAFGYFTSGGGVARYNLWTGEAAGHASIGGLVYATPAVVDLDGDGRSEVLVGRFAQTSRPAPGHEQPELAVLSEDLESLEKRVKLANFTWARALPVDLDHDGDKEVLTFGLRGEIETFEPSRGWKRRWQTNIGGRINNAGVAVGSRSAPDIAVISMTKDGSKDDLVVVAGRDGRVLARHHDGGARASSPLALDADNDGDTELYALGVDGNLRKFDRDWTHPVWTRRVAVAGPQGSPLPSAPLGMGRLSRDSPPVLAMAWRDGSVAIVDAADGAVVWRNWVGAEVESRPLLVDVDGDGTSEFIVATHEGRLLCLRIGAAKWEELRGTGPF